MDKQAFPVTQRLLQMDQDCKSLSATINELETFAFPPDAQKKLRQYTATESAKLLGCTGAHLKKVAHEVGIVAERRKQNSVQFFTLEQLRELRPALAERELTRRTGPIKRRDLEFDPRRKGNEALQVFACANYKGGSAKTTTAVHAAQYLALKGYRVLLIDLDPQGSASNMFGIHPERVGEEKSLYGAIRYDNPIPLSEVRQSTYFPGIDIVAGGPLLQEWEFDAPRLTTEYSIKLGEIKRQLESLSDKLNNSTQSRAADAELQQELRDLETLYNATNVERMYFMRLKATLKTVETDYDVVVCDTPPNLGYLSNAATFAADHLLVTIYPQWLDCDSMEQYLRTSVAHQSQFERMVVSLFGESVIPKNTLHYLITRHDPTSRPETDVSALLRSRLSNVLTNPMLKSSAIAEAGNAQQTVYEAVRADFNPKTYDRAVDALNVVNREIEEILFEAWGREI